ncbi:tetratricopeptide repeat protein [Flavobacterium gelatinilyticum]|uniref:tetratricopeptide repeat protein n=1 Tax=Flavobacterium gelatinilyticum TaxID=3003260 RepID=UPI0024804ABC|nr:tetratricopeptide repeat protein [Flavobacterium gelatinilyticum]
MKNLLVISFIMISFSSWSQSAEVFFNKAFNKAAAGNYKGAIADYTKAISKNSKMVEAYQNRGVAKYKLKDLKGALADFNKTIELDDMNADAFTGRANANFSLSNFVETIEDCTLCLGLNPRDYIAYNLRGLAYSKIGDKKNACLDFSKAIELGSKSAAVNKASTCK